jgi:hypothetical protein
MAYAFVKDSYTFTVCSIFEFDFYIKQSIARLNVHPQITINNLDKSVQTKVTTIGSDNELSLVIELKDDT